MDASISSRFKRFTCAYIFNLFRSVDSRVQIGKFRIAMFWLITGVSEAFYTERIEKIPMGVIFFYNIVCQDLIFHLLEFCTFKMVKHYVLEIRKENQVGNLHFQDYIFQNQV